MTHDIFISYSRHDLAAVKPIKEELESHGFSCWMDIDGIESGDVNFKRKIVPALDGCKIVLFFISTDFQKSEWTIKELDYAKRHEKRVIPLRFNDDPLVGVFDFDYGSADVIDWRVQEQKEKLRRDLDKWSSRQSNQKHAASSGVWQDDPTFIQQFDRPAYARIKKALKSFRVLDLGSGDGRVAMSRFGRTGKPLKYLVIDCEKNSVDSGNRRFRKNRSICFHKADLEDSSCQEAIETGMKQLGIKTFNVINITMVLLYLKEPKEVLCLVKKYLAKGGFLVIRDIDDGLCVANPDKDRSFRTAIDLCGKTKTTGERNTGRQVFTTLQNAGFTDIRLENLCVSTCGMDDKGREDLFEFYFKSLRNDLQATMKEKSADKRCSSVLQDNESLFDTLHSSFMKKDFFFTLGLVLFTARG